MIRKMIDIIREDKGSAGINGLALVMLLLVILLPLERYTFERIYIDAQRNMLKNTLNAALTNTYVSLEIEDTAEERLTMDQESLEKNFEREIQESLRLTSKWTAEEQASSIEELSIQNFVFYSTEQIPFTDEKGQVHTRPCIYLKVTFPIVVLSYTRQVTMASYYLLPLNN